MKRIVFFLCSAYCLVLPDSGRPANWAGLHEKNQYIGFLQYLPEGYATASFKYPLIISLHSLGEKGNGTTELTNVQCCGISRLHEGRKEDALYLEWKIGKLYRIDAAIE